MRGGESLLVAEKGRLPSAAAKHQGNMSRYRGEAGGGFVLLASLAVSDWLRLKR